MNTPALVIVGLTATTVLVRGLGPVLTGGRTLPARAQGVIALLAPALLGALVAVGTLTSDSTLTLGPQTVGVAAAGVTMWRTGSIVACVVVAAAVTAGLRAL